MGAKRMTAVKHNIRGVREKSQYLEEVCTEEQLEEIKKWMKKGAVFLVLGSDYTYTREFYKGLHQLMYSPVFNGAAIYDSHYKYVNAFDRPYIKIGLNDACNESRIDNIQRLDRYRSKTVYTCHYEEEKPRVNQLRPIDVIGRYLGISDVPEQAAKSSHEGMFFKNINLLPTDFFNVVAWRWFLWMPALTQELWESNSYARDGVDFSQTFIDKARDIGTVVDSFVLEPDSMLTQVWIPQMLSQFYRILRIVQLNYASLSGAWDAYLEYYKDSKHIWRCLEDSYRILSNLFTNDIWVKPIVQINYHDTMYEKLVQMRNDEVYTQEDFDVYAALDELFNLEVK